MGNIQRTIEVEDERQTGKSLDEDARGVLKRLAGAPDATIEDLGTDKLKLREGDNRDAMISAVRQEAAKMAKFTIVANPQSKTLEVNEDPLKAVETDPRLTPLREQFEALDEKYRTFGGKVRSFDEVLKAATNVNNLLSEMAKLKQGIVYFLSDKGELVLGDGCPEPLKETLGWNYHKSRSEATRVSCVDDRGEIITIEGDDTEIPEGAKVVSERGLITLDEYKLVNRGQFEKGKVIWTESGKNPSVARNAFWNDVGVGWCDVNSDDEGDGRGSRRVLRVKLNFES